MSHSVNIGDLVRIKPSDPFKRNRNIGIVINFGDKEIWDTRGLYKVVSIEVLWDFGSGWIDSHRIEKI
jgi:hypothetical protein